MNGKRVLITINPGLLRGKRFSTVRSMVTHLNQQVELLLVPCDGFDFRRRKLKAYRRVERGMFSLVGSVSPAADLWINYSDGYYLDVKKLGFKRKIDYLNAQFEFYQESLEKGLVKRLINTVEAEKHSLKGWLCRYRDKDDGVIPTYRLSDWVDVAKLLKDVGSLVCKPDWGGAGVGAKLLHKKDDLQQLQDELRDANEDLSDVVFQEYAKGAEKRLWFLGGEFVDGRVVFNKGAPWDGGKTEARVRRYNNPRNAEFRHDLEVAQRVCRQSGIEIGSIDFIGDRVNEINGCGTIFTAYEGWVKKVDARRQLLDFLDGVITTL